MTSIEDVVMLRLAKIRVDFDCLTKGRRGIGCPDLFDFASFLRGVRDLRGENVIRVDRRKFTTKLPKGAKEVDGFGCAVRCLAERDGADDCISSSPGHGRHNERRSARHKKWANLRTSQRLKAYELDLRRDRSSTKRNVSATHSGWRTLGCVGDCPFRCRTHFRRSIFTWSAQTPVRSAWPPGLRLIGQYKNIIYIMIL